MDTIKSVFPSVPLLPLIKELDVINPEWMGGIQTSQKLNIKVNVKDLIDTSNNNTFTIINF